MPVRFETYQYSYLRNGKPVFVPSARGEVIGYEIKAKVETATAFDPFFYHLRQGGHVAALHSHRGHRYFARVDIERFFYGIGRNRVAHALWEIGVSPAGPPAKWSCVRNPYGEPAYALPYGFVQSPLLATLVLMRSGVGAFLRGLPAHITVSVYMDDISLSADDLAVLQTAFEDLRVALADGHFCINEAKTRTPALAIDLFNCDLTHGKSTVREKRRAEYYALERSAASEQSFERYCASVAHGNIVLEL